MLQVYSNVYASLDPSATLYFVTPLVGLKFDMLPNVLSKPFLVISPVGDSGIGNRVYRSYPIMLPNRVTLVDLVEIDMINSDVIWVWIG